MKYFWMLWRTFWRHNVRLEILFDIIILSDVMTHLVDLMNKQHSLGEGK